MPSSLFAGFPASGPAAIGYWLLWALLIFCFVCGAGAWAGETRAARRRLLQVRQAEQAQCRVPVVPVVPVVRHRVTGTRWSPLPSRDADGTPGTPGTPDAQAVAPLAAPRHEAPTMPSLPPLPPLAPLPPLPALPHMPAVPTVPTVPTVRTDLSEEAAMDGLIRAWGLALAYRWRTWRNAYAPVAAQYDGAKDYGTNSQAWRVALDAFPAAPTDRDNDPWPGE